jgi:integrase
MLVVDPIKNVAEIDRMKKILQSQSQRNLLLFVMGINTPLRVSELLQLKVGDVLDEEGNILSVISLRAKKTDKITLIPLNDTVKMTMEDYPPLKFDREAALFPTQKSHERLKDSSKNKPPLSRTQVYRIMRAAAAEAGLTKVGTETLRKTFGYQMYQKTGRLGIVQQVLNQDSAAHLIQFIGLTPENQDDIDEDMKRAYLDLNL